MTSSNMNMPEAKPLADAGPVHYSLVGGEQAARGRRLFNTSLVLLVATLGYLGYAAKVVEPEHRYLGLLMFALSFLPALFWARSGGNRFPIIETIMALCANAYALPVLNAQDQLAGYSPAVITQASLAVLLYQVSAIAIYLTTRGRPGRSRFWCESIITEQVERLTIYGIVVSAAYVWMSEFTNWIPNEFISSLRAIFYGVSILSTFISAQRWGRGELTSREKSIFVVFFVPQLVMLSAGLLLISSISLIGVALLGYLSGGKRIPWVVIGLTFATLAVLHTGKTKMRMKYWENELPPPTISELPAFYAEWFAFGLEPTSGDKTVSHKLLERSSLMHILCLIVDYTPSRQDYLYGKTYQHVIPQLIPRFFWPEKPRSHVATFELGIYYGLQRAEDTNSTTIAFGLLTEAYANFGLIGAFGLGAFWGFVLKKLQIRSTYSPMFSLGGLLMILLTAWSLNAELTMAAWVSSFEQAVIMIIGLPMIARTFLGL
jgi:hypothetical protein